MRHSVGCVGVQEPL